MKITVRSAVADILKQEKTEYVFGYNGRNITYLYQAITDETDIKIILNRQEGNAAYMADGYARITKKPSVIFTTSGPGATNLVTGLSTSFMDSIPIVAICASSSTFSFGRNGVQDGSGLGTNPEQKAIFKACCKQAILVPSPESVPNILRGAFRISKSGRQGPVYVEVPIDFWNRKIEYERISTDKSRNISLHSCNEINSKMIEKELYESKHPFIVIGEGAEEPNLQNKLNNFLNKTKIPFTVSPIGKNYIDEYNELYMGSMIELGSDRRAHEYMRRSDFILFLGDRMQEWEMNWYDKTLIDNAKIAQIDIDPGEIGRVYPIDFSAVGSISSFIDLIEINEHYNSHELRGEVYRLSEQINKERRYKDDNGINPININNIVEEQAAEDGSIVCDTGCNKKMTVMKFRTNLSQNFVVADKNGPMGYSVPAALGVALATKKEVVCFVGDGGFQMSLNELGTAMEYGLKVIFVIHNNGGCSSIMDLNIINFGKTCADSFHNPDFAKIAESYNLIGYRAKTTEEFGAVFKKAQKSDKSVIIDAQVNQSIMSW
ncbi:MAG TPA: thiamine pyrophosphate-binding protein [Victivallales bacterium]|nr:thiamine pyrophosphate-binding protein [Victivallales bacterium]